jgi:hypothetical protein
MRLIINTFDSLAPIWHSSGVLCISHPRVPRHIFTGPAPSPVCLVPDTRIITHISPVIHVPLGFRDTDRTMVDLSKLYSFPRQGSVPCGVRAENQLPRTSGLAPILHPPRLRHGTIFFASELASDPHRTLLSTNHVDPLWFHTDAVSLLLGSIKGTHQ